ncbi:MAG: phosphodiesterase [Gammaproteobacteria bacterium]|nr:MAG: phosphodiesterase [Gammaproteobacteria bacterium]
MLNPTMPLFTWIQRNGRRLQWWMVPSLAVMMAGVFLLVYATGGIKYVFSHSMYIPIMLGGLVFGIRGGILVGLVAGIVLGPFMPIDTVTGEMQLTVNWLYRTGFFTLIGLSAGAVSDFIRRYIAHLQWLVHHDEASGLPNQRFLNDLLRKKNGEHDALALVVVSVENVSELKAVFGPQVMDCVIRGLAEHSHRAMPGLQLACRTGAYDLGLLVANGDEDGLKRQLRDLAGTFQEPLLYSGIPLHSDIRMAFVPVGKEGAAESYLKKAESAMIAAREKGLHMAAYSVDDDLATADTIYLLGELKQALDTGQLEMHYQPKVSSADGRVESVEALVRWHHPEMGDIPPGKFIPRAENSTLINEVTAYALDASLAQLKSWQQAGVDLTVAVNVSAGDLANPEFVGQVFGLLEKHSLSGACLELEITENGFIHDIENSICQLKKLTEANIAISIDDFGTGYSSLKYLHDLPASTIKLDQSFVSGLPENGTAASIAEMTRALASNLRLRTVAEGVETEEARQFLVKHGFDLLQGYFIAKPMSGDDFCRWYLNLPEPGYWSTARRGGVLN